MPDSKKGIIIVFILGILAILITITIAGLTLTMTTAKISKIDIVKKYSQFAADSGVQYALASIFHSTSDWFYWGEDFNKNYQLDEGEDLNKNGILDTISAPLDGRHYPSLYSGNYQLDKGDNIYYSREVSLSEQYKIVFALKIIDESNKIYAKPLNSIKMTFLKNLCSILHIELPDDVMDLNELKTKLTYSDFVKLANYINFSDGSTHRIVYPQTLLKENTAIFTRLQLLPVNFKEYNLEMLNLNSAPWEVILANLSNIEAIYFEENTSPYAINFAPAEIGVWDYWKIVREKSSLIKKLINMGRASHEPVKLGVMKKYTLPYEKASLITQRIIERRKQSYFTSYRELYNFLNKLVVEKEIGELDRDIVFANLHPNPPSNTFTPFADFPYKISKENITKPTLPFGFIPQGTFHIESLGLVIDIKDKKIIAKDRLKVSARLSDFVSYRTYKEFSQFTFEGLDIYPFSKEFTDKMKVDLNSFIGVKFYQPARDENIIFYSSNREPKNIEVDNEGLEGYIPAIYKGYTPFFTTEGIYSGQGHLLRIPASAINIVDLKDIAKGMMGCDLLRDVYNLILGQGCGKAIKGSISFLYKPLFDTVNSKKARIIFTLNNFKEGEVSALNVVAYISRKFWKDYFPLLANYFIGAPAWAWESFRVGFYFVATVNTTRDPEVIMQGKWTHFKLVFDTTNYKNIADGAKIYIDGVDCSKHLGATSKLFLSGGIFGVPDYFTNNYLRFGESYKAPAWNFPQDGIYNRITVSKDIEPPKYKEMQISDINEKQQFFIPPFAQRKFVTSIYLESFSRISFSVEILDKKGEVLYATSGHDIVNLNFWVEPEHKIKVKIDRVENDYPIITGLIIGTLKSSAQYLEYSHPVENQ